MAVLSRMSKVGLSLTAAAVAAGAAYCYENKRGHFTLRAAQPATTSNDQASSLHSNLSNELFPRTKWHSDWDSRDPLSLVDPVKYETADKYSRQEMLNKATATATRNIFLIRHGQYFMDNGQKNLTPLGREQATLLGKRLAESGQKFDLLVMSSMPRASETASLILQELSEIPSRIDSLLEEGAPYPPEPPIKHWRPKQRKFFAEGSRIEAAFRKYIHRASPKQKEDSYELIVCHGNVIRYFVCRALQFPPEGWLRMTVGNCSITWLVIRPSGNVSLRSLGDIGHLPRDKMTFT